MTPGNRPLLWPHSTEQLTSTDITIMTRFQYTLIFTLFLAVDYLAFIKGKQRGREATWYHVIPGGGFVRLYESYHPSGQ